MAGRPDAELKVKEGEYVCIGGRWFRVAGVNALFRKVNTQRLTGDGALVSSDWARVDLPGGGELESVPAPGADTSPWAPVPEHLTDGLARARFVMRSHTAHLVAHGVGDDD